MKRRCILLVLSVCVTVFCLHNVYQSWTIVQVPDTHTKMTFGDGPRPIEIISGGRTSRKLWDLGVKINPHSADSGPASHGLSQSSKEHKVNWTEISQFEEKIVNADRSDKTKPQVIANIPAAKANHLQQDLDADIPVPKCALFNGSQPVYKMVNGIKRIVPIWQQKLKKCGRLGQYVNDTWQVVLAELLQVRVYKEDKAKWTIGELKQWLHYMFLSGVEHIFLCDHFMYEYERLDIPLKQYIDLGLITYMPWSTIRNPMSAQVRCYQSIIDNYKHNTRWQMAVDMDEYPFSPIDSQEGFLVRYLKNITARYGVRVTEVSMANYLMLGQGDRNRSMVIDRINRMTPKPANVLVKPIYRPARVKANIHHNHIVFGTHMNAEDNELKMLHYWGARGQDWGPDTPHTLSITTEMNNMRLSWADQIKNSLLVFGEFDAFSNSTGP